MVCVHARAHMERGFLFASILNKHWLLFLLTLGTLVWNIRQPNMISRPDNPYQALLPLLLFYCLIVGAGLRKNKSKLTTGVENIWELWNFIEILEKQKFQEISVLMWTQVKVLGKQAKIKCLLFVWNLLERGTKKKNPMHIMKTAWLLQDWEIKGGFNIFGDDWKV